MVSLERREVMGAGGASCLAGLSPLHRGRGVRPGWALPLGRSASVFRSAPLTSSISLLSFGGRWQVPSCHSPVLLSASRYRRFQLVVVRGFFSSELLSVS